MATSTCYRREEEECSSGDIIWYCSYFPFDEYSEEYIEVSFTSSTGVDETTTIYYNLDTDLPSDSRRSYTIISEDTQGFPDPTQPPYTDKITVRTDNFEVRWTYLGDLCSKSSAPVGQLVSNLVTNIVANPKPKGSTRLLLRAVEYPNPTTFIYEDAGVSGFAVSPLGLVTPPTNTEGTIKRLTYSTGYNLSTGYYPTSSTQNITRSVDVDVKVPNDPEYINANGFVSGSEYYIQLGAPTYISGSWATTSNSNYGHFKGQVLVGTTNDSLLIGEGRSSFTITDTVESWNGISWTTETGYSQTLYNWFAAVGDPSDTITTGGTKGGSAPTIADTYNYNGSTWSTLSNLVTAAKTFNGVGTTSDMLVIGGSTGAGNLNITQRYNGASWATDANYVLTGQGISAFGTTADTATGTGAFGDHTATFDGISWAYANDLPYSNALGAAFGSQTSGILVGGNWDGYSDNIVTNFNGISWGYTSNVPYNTFQAYKYPGGAGSSAASGKYSMGDGYPVYQYNRNFDFSS